MYERKVNGRAGAGEFLGANIDFFTVSTAALLNTPAVLDKVVEVISLNGQPIIMGAVTGSGPYVLKFANEHTGAWDKATLEAALLAHAGITATVTPASSL